MQPKTTVWELEPHTTAKHEILRRYVQAWAPILSQGNFPHLVFVDGFAGPGRYSKGEEGSPIIAIKAVIDQPRPIKAKVDFHFIELDVQRSGHLAAEIGSLSLPANVSATPSLWIWFYAAGHSSEAALDSREAFISQFRGALADEQLRLLLEEWRDQ
jgi:three-Cys-motif partner protein